MVIDGKTRARFKFLKTIPEDFVTRNYHRMIWTVLKTDAGHAALLFYRNFELIFEFMALKRAPICGRNVCLSFFFWVFLYLIVIFLIVENKKNLTLCQNNEKWTKIQWILGQYNSRHVIKNVTLKLTILYDIEVWDVSNPNLWRIVRLTIR